LNNSALTEAAIRDWCTRYLAETLSLPANRVDPDVKFARLGMDSAMAAFFLVGLEDWLGIELPQDVVFEYPTIAQLARHLASEHATGRVGG
jgi:acyl carrier protein